MQASKQSCMRLYMHPGAVSSLLKPVAVHSRSRQCHSANSQDVGLVHASQSCIRLYMRFGAASPTCSNHLLCTAAAVEGAASLYAMMGRYDSLRETCVKYEAKHERVAIRVLNKERAPLSAEEVAQLKQDLDGEDLGEREVRGRSALRQPNGVIEMLSSCLSTC